MKKLALFALLGVAFTGGRLSAETIEEREKFIKGQNSKPLKPTPDAQATETNEAKTQDACASKVAAAADDSCAGVSALSTSSRGPITQRFVPLGAPQAFSVAPAGVGLSSVAPFSVGVASAPVIASGPVVLSQPFVATTTAPVILNSFVPNAGRGYPYGYGAAAVRQPTVAAAASGYVLYPTVKAIPHDTHSASGADYTVYYRGVGSVVIQSPRQFPVGDGQTMAPVYVPTPVAYPANPSR